MLLSHKVIKQVGSEMEDWPVYPRICFAHEDEEEYLAAEDLVEDAEDIIKSARAEAEKMLADTNNRILVIEQEAYDRGYKKAEEDVWQSHKKAQEEFYLSTGKVLSRIKEIREKTYNETENEIVDLAVHIAEKLVCRQLELNPETIVDIAKAACIQAKECELVIIYVQPDQIESLKARQDEIASQLYKTKRLEIIADPNIQCGGCRVETEQGYIDATITTMINQLNTVIKEEA